MQHDHVFFELTKSEKLRRIAEVGCTHFIDDLPEFPDGRGFPSKVVRILFGPNQNHGEIEIIQPASSWTENCTNTVAVKEPCLLVRKNY